MVRKNMIRHRVLLNDYTHLLPLLWVLIMLNTVSHHLKKKSIVTLENSSTKSREPSLFENKKTYYSKLVMAVNILHFGIAMEIFSNLCMSDITVM